MGNKKLNKLKSNTVVEDESLHSRKIDSLEDVASGIAHDFNNMLSGILGCSEILLQKTENEPDLQKFANLIHKTALQATAFTKRLHSFSPKKHMYYELIDIHKSIELALLTMKDNIDEEIKIDSTFRAVNSFCRGDLSIFADVLNNIIHNSIDAMPSGGLITIKTENKLVNNDEFLVIFISDNGSGMTDKVQKNIFTPFFTTRHKEPGKGLGLSSVYSTIDYMDGFIEVESEINSGSLFKIYLPVS